TGSLYPKTYWELLPKEILRAATQRDTGRYYPKRDWDVLWENGARKIARQGGRWWRGHGCHKGVKGFLEALDLKGGDGGACKVLGWLLGDGMELIEVLGC
ncbi:hypothetical protein Tco_0883839, partial [Tanacetum coccineum]